MSVSFCGKRILTRSNYLKIPKRNGYIVLVPEIGDDLPYKDPLLKEDKLPAFNTITVEKCIAAIAKQSIEFEECVKNTGEKLQEKENIDVFEDALNFIEEMHLSLEVTWGIAKTLYVGNQSNMPTKTYYNIHTRAKTATSSRYCCKPIFQLCKKLEGKKMKEFTYVGNMMISKTTEIKEKVEVATKLFSHVIKDPIVVRDFPAEYLKIIATDPSQPYVGPWTITLHPYVMETFMEYCPERAMRWKVWEANVIKASVYHDRFIQTSSALEELRHYRKRKAEILGYKSYAHLSMETKMAGTLENLYATLDQLLQTARPAQEEEFKELTEFAQERGLEGDIKPWDVAYWGRKLENSKYNISSIDIKAYFPFPKVLSGLFNLIEMLFSIKVVENNRTDVWHKDVRFFDVFDLKESNTMPIANFYLDCYVSGDEKKRTTDLGWMLAIKNRSKRVHPTPLVALIFNFQSPAEGKPALLSFREVWTLFAQFGHALKYLLTTINYAEVSGFSFVEWDAVRIPDYFLAYWLYEPSILKQISGHYDTNEALPMVKIDTLIKMRSHLAGYKLCKELYLSQMDLELHDSKQFWVNIMNRLWSKYFVYAQQKKDCHVCSFTSILTEGWGAAYYSNIWSQMIAADVYNAFQEIDINNKQQCKEIGHRYRDTFLSLGGVYPMSEIFRRFRGRDPNPQALFYTLGLENMKRQKKP
ncbi:hypothetical protein KM043_017552 [Ampulex compressa]|nr:hypothetical protein KM043_017552 [Ampulex compressa]